MFLIDGPYISTFLKQTLERFKIPVVSTQAATSALEGFDIQFVGEDEAMAQLASNPQLRLHTNSENTLGWLYKNNPESKLSKTTQMVKDKVKFREQLKQLHPKYYFKACPLAELSAIQAETIPFPIILKPSVGFFSLGVHTIENADQWEVVIQNLDDTLQKSTGLYPSGVLDNSTFILEEVIPGEEFAVDCYFDENGSVVILNLMQHLFAEDTDVNDRIYQTSGPIVETYLQSIESYLNQLGDLFELQNYSAHIELRIDHQGSINAIEINPLRFGGWCTTADIAKYAWGINLYEYVFKQKQVDWLEKINTHQDYLYALIVLDNNTGIAGNRIEHFDYVKAVETLSDPLEIREVNYKAHPLFGFVMCRVKLGAESELKPLLHSNLREFITWDQAVDNTR